MILLIPSTNAPNAAAFKLTPIVSIFPILLTCVDNDRVCNCKATNGSLVAWIELVELTTSTRQDKPSKRGKDTRFSIAASRQLGKLENITYNISIV